MYCPIEFADSSAHDYFQAKKKVNYMESDSEGEDDDEEIFRPQPLRKRRRPAVESEDEFEIDGADAHASEDGS